MGGLLLCPGELPDRMGRMTMNVVGAVHRWKERRGGRVIRVGRIAGWRVGRLN